MKFDPHLVHQFPASTTRFASTEKHGPDLQKPSPSENTDTQGRSLIPQSLAEVKKRPKRWKDGEGTKKGDCPP